MWAQLTDETERIAKENDFSGVVSITKEGATIYQKAFGYADIANKRENRVDTIFGIASGTKFFTALAIGILIERGKLSLEDKAFEVIEYNFPTYSNKVTIAHLLTHTSGIPDYYPDDECDGEKAPSIACSWSELIEPEDYLRILPHEKMMFEPGEEFFYNSSAFILLAYIVAKVSGKRYSDFVRDEILMPCGMENSGFFSFDRLPPNTANGYIKCGEGFRTNIYDLPPIGGGDGGMYTTAQDLVKFWDCLLSYKILSKETTKLFLEDKVEAVGEGDDIYYGYGVWVKKKDGKVGEYITGFDMGVSFNSQISRDKNITVSVLSNKSSGTWPLVRYLENELIFKD